MSDKSRDDFTESVKRTVAERAAYRCSNPACRDLTIVPHSDPEKSLKLGEAAHISAAAPGGPRFDADQTSDERRGSENAIWLCRKCAALIDKDVLLHTADVLREWRQRHEDWIRNGSVVPRTPKLTLESVAGLVVPETPGTYKIDSEVDLRQHRLAFENVAEAPIFAINAKIQFPEPVYHAEGKFPAGVNVTFAPDRPLMVFRGTPGAGITRERPPLPTGSCTFEVDKLAPGQAVEILFQTSMKVLRDHDMSFDTGIWRDFHQGDHTSHFFNGQFQYEDHGAMVPRCVFGPIAFDKDKRTMSFTEVRNDFGPWKLSVLSVWS